LWRTHSVSLPLFSFKVQRRESEWRGHKSAAGTSAPIASCETLCEQRDFKPFFEQYAMDVPIIVMIWKGYMEPLKIAAMAAVYEMNVAPHDFYGHMSSVISAYFCATVPNFRIAETEVDSVPWRDQLVDRTPVICNSEFREAYGHAEIEPHPVQRSLIYSCESNSYTIFPPRSSDRIVVKCDKVD
jgi:hypothetical protein